MDLMISSKIRCVCYEIKRGDNCGFTNSIFDMLIRQEKHVKDCLIEPKLDGKHYIETTDGKFILLRGTNRNESLHRRYVFLTWKHSKALDHSPYKHFL